MRESLLVACSMIFLIAFSAVILCSCERSYAIFGFEGVLDPVKKEKFDEIKRIESEIERDYDLKCGKIYPKHHDQC